MKTRYLTLFTVLTCLGLAIPTFAAKPNCAEDDTHPSCKPADDSGVDAMYSVAISEAVTGASGSDWLGSFGGKNKIGANEFGVATGIVGVLSDLGFFRDDADFLGELNGANCFADGSFLSQGLIGKGRGGRAEASFWFDGLTADGGTSVLYVLSVFGQFDDGAAKDVWPPANVTTLGMTDWDIDVENEPADIRNRSCVGAGDEVEMSIVVTRTN